MGRVGWLLYDLFQIAITLSTIIELSAISGFEKTLIGNWVLLWVIVVNGMVIMGVIVVNGVVTKGKSIGKSGGKSICAPRYIHYYMVDNVNLWIPWIITVMVKIKNCNCENRDGNEYIYIYIFCTVILVLIKYLGLELELVASAWSELTGPEEAPGGKTGRDDAPHENW